MYIIEYFVKRYNFLINLKNKKEKNRGGGAPGHRKFPKRSNNNVLGNYIFDIFF